MHIGTIWKKGGCSNIFDFGGQKKEKEKKRWWGGSRFSGIYKPFQTILHKCIKKNTNKWQEKHLPARPARSAIPGLQPYI